MVKWGSLLFDLPFTPDLGEALFIILTPPSAFGLWLLIQSVMRF